MIENLQGLHETVNYKDNTNLRLYINDEFEEYPPHWHIPIEIIMPIENTYQLICQEQPCTLNPGDILIICPGILHHLFACPGKRYIFQADVSSSFMNHELESVLTLISPLLIITKESFPDCYNRIHQLFLEIADEYAASQTLYEASVYSKLMEIMVLISRTHIENRGHFSTSFLKQKEYIEKFMEICDYINEHCTEDLTLDMIANLSGFSKYHFTRLFKQFTNVSFYKYLNQKRMAKAEEYLINPEMSVTDVALSCGFSSLSSFIRMFKIMKGCTPSKYRSMHIPIS